MEHVIDTCCLVSETCNYYACVEIYIEFLNFNDKYENIKSLTKEIEQQLMNLGYNYAPYWTTIHSIIKTKVHRWKREEMDKRYGDNYPF